MMPVTACSSAKDYKDFDPWLDMKKRKHDQRMSWYRPQMEENWMASKLEKKKKALSELKKKREALEKDQKKAKDSRCYCFPRKCNKPKEYNRPLNFCAGIGALKNKISDIEYDISQIMKKKEKHRIGVDYTEEEWAEARQIYKQKKEMEKAEKRRNR